MNTMNKICLISFSDNADNQNMIYSMFYALKDKIDVYTIGINRPKSDIAAFTDKNFYFDCPKRPGINKETFRLHILWKIKKTIKKYNIKLLYFESQHIWNALLMAICPDCKKIVAVHDVIPHDGNRSMSLSNFVTCHMADQIVLRNKKYLDELVQRYKLSKDCITCMDMWRYWPPENPCNHTGIFLCFGRIRKYKGLDLLLQIAQKTPEANFRVVGSSDEESKNIVEQLKKLANVDVTDKEVSDEEMRKCFQDADWVILPYVEATQSGVIVDSYKYSRPVIAFNVGAISEQVEDGVSGFLIPAGKTEQFSCKIKEVLSMSKNTMESYTRNSYTFGRDKYSAESMSNQFLLMVESII